MPEEKELQRTPEQENEQESVYERSAQELAQRAKEVLTELTGKEAWATVYGAWKSDRRGIDFTVKFGLAGEKNYFSAECVGASCDLFEGIVISGTAGKTSPESIQWEDKEQGGHTANNLTKEVLREILQGMVAKE